MFEMELVLKKNVDSATNGALYKSAQLLQLVPK